MSLKLMAKTILFSGLVAIGLALSGCHGKPKTNIEKIDDLIMQVKNDAVLLNDLEAKDFVTLEKDFMTCDSLLQYQSPEQIDKSFETLQLVQAYLEQFRTTKSMMRSELDSTLLQLDRLKTDAESHYLSDSLVTAYLENETEFANTLNNQVLYFQDRFDNCQKDLDVLKKQKSVWP